MKIRVFQYQLLCGIIGLSLFGCNASKSTENQATTSTVSQSSSIIGEYAEKPGGPSILRVEKRADGLYMIVETGPKRIEETKLEKVDVKTAKEISAEEKEAIIEMYSAGAIGFMRLKPGKQLFGKEASEYYFYPNGPVYKIK